METRSTRKAATTNKQKSKTDSDNSSNSRCGSDEDNYSFEEDEIDGSGETDSSNEDVDEEDEIGKKCTRQLKRKKPDLKKKKTSKRTKNEMPKSQPRGKKHFIQKAHSPNPAVPTVDHTTVDPSTVDPTTVDPTTMVNPTVDVYEELRTKIKNGLCSMEELEKIKENLLNSIKAFPTKYPNYPSNIREIIVENSDEICELFHNYNISLKDFIVKLCTLLWPQTDICCLDCKSFDVFRSLFYSILAESLDDEEKDIFRKYEGKSAIEFNDALMEEEESKEIIAEIKAKRQKTLTKIKNKFDYLKNSFKKIKQEIKLRLCAIIDDTNNDVNTHLQVNLNIDDTIDDVIVENNCVPLFCFYDDSEDLIEWDYIEKMKMFTGLFKFIDPEEDGIKKNTNDDADDNSESSDSIVFVENPQRTIRISIAFLYLIAGGYCNSPSYAKLGCSTASDESFFNRMNHYWIGSNPRYCFRLFV
jgi:hypothetical protein